MQPFDFILSLLATFRVSNMIADEAGPAKMFIRLRTSPHLPQGVRDGLKCPLCVSVWIAAVCALWLASWRRLTLPMAGLAWLAISGGSVILSKVLPK